jgi:molybdopterin-guanine dinucleotide biosynthesis protein A
MIFGLVLAGGRSSRFGAEKALAEFGGRSLFDRALAVLAPDCAQLAISAGEASGIAQIALARGVERLADPPDAPRGPLAGVLAGLIWAKAGGAALLATAPCDTPFLPPDLVVRLVEGLAESHPAAVASAPDGLHPLCGLWRTHLVEPLAAALADGRHPPVREMLRRLGGQSVDFPDAAAFFNVNTRADLACAARRTGASSGRTA